MSAETKGQRITIEGRVFDGSGTPVRDVLLELWQANADGRYNHPDDRQQSKTLDPNFRGWGARVQTLHPASGAFKPSNPARSSAVTDA